ncbi:hypothetical protein RvY_19071 [Ramazzottius varieornatus]|uniref:Uncharacterized protein n=1 Tax=Ramazzottius varieornatus TaxID=947166 RepID=A0A1D1WC14_RAMVA|nr:hypothetical protein RvY_19071 [Ramazzottius varieornatus]
MSNLARRQNDNGGWPLPYRSRGLISYLLPLQAPVIQLDKLRSGMGRLNNGDKNIILVDVETLRTFDVLDKLPLDAHWIPPIAQLERVTKYL